MILHRVCLYGFLVPGASGSASTTLRFLNYSTINKIQWIFNFILLTCRILARGVSLFNASGSGTAGFASISASSSRIN